jgi:hypothetical protein
MKLTYSEEELRQWKTNKIEIERDWKEFFAYIRARAEKRSQNITEMEQVPDEKINKFLEEQRKNEEERVKDLEIRIQEWKNKYQK